MFEIASQMILCLLLAALIGAIIGYIFGKSTCKDTCEESETTPVPSSEKEVIEESAKPILLSQAREGGKDNLTRVKGIGLKIEGTLNEIGIYHFDQIASWTEENVTWVDDNVAFPGRVKREQWVEQAISLAKGEETEFSKRVDAGEVASSKAE